MKDVLSKLATTNGEIIFEYDIPSLGKRVDVVLLLKGIVFCLEFKVGKTKISENDIDQVLDYALDLKNFHRESHEEKLQAQINGYKKEIKSIGRGITDAIRTSQDDT